jgi:hypothetical protein
MGPDSSPMVLGSRVQMEPIDDSGVSAFTGLRLCLSVAGNSQQRTKEHSPSGAVLLASITSNSNWEITSRFGNYKMKWQDSESLLPRRNSAGIFEEKTQSN